MTVSSVVQKAAVVAKDVEAKVVGEVQLAELTYKQARGPFLVGAGAGVAAAVIVLLVMHFLTGIL